VEGTRGKGVTVAAFLAASRGPRRVSWAAWRCSPQKGPLGPGVRGGNRNRLAPAIPRGTGGGRGGVQASTGRTGKPYACGTTCRLGASTKSTRPRGVEHGAGRDAWKNGAVDETRGELSVLLVSPLPSAQEWRACTSLFDCAHMHCTPPASPRGHEGGDPSNHLQPACRRSGALHICCLLRHPSRASACSPAPRACSTRSLTHPGAP
jgi:hypothetical protein